MLISEHISAIGGGHRDSLSSMPRPLPTRLVLALLLASSLGQAQESTRKILVRVPAKYPAVLKSKEIGGLVKVRVVISPSGTVRSTVLVGGNPVLAEAAITAIKEWRYERAAGETATVVELRFDLH